MHKRSKEVAFFESDSIKLSSLMIVRDHFNHLVDCQPRQERIKFDGDNPDRAFP